MLKYSTHVLLIVAAVAWAQALYTKVNEKPSLRDVAVDFVGQSWKNRRGMPEVDRSKALERLEAIKNREWKGLGNFFLQLLDIAEAGGRSSAAKNPAAVDRQTANNSDESIDEIMRELFAEILLTGANSSEEPVLEEKFKDAIGMKFHTIDDFAEYCIKVFEDVTGRTSPDKT